MAEWTKAPHSPRRSGAPRKSRKAGRLRGEMQYYYNMYYVYVLYSTKDSKLYIGSTGDLRQRIVAHNQGQVSSTKHRRPMRLICYEAYLEKTEAQRRERYLKSSNGHRDLKKRLNILMVGSHSLA